jgi:hypothetical protein
MVILHVLSNVSSIDPLYDIDLVLTHGLHDISQPVALDQFSLDHLPVLSDVYSGSLGLNPQIKVPTYKNANWPSFMSYLNQELD